MIKPEYILESLQYEIDWCLDHPDEDLTKDQQMGFMNGLRQAQTIITKMMDAEKVRLKEYAP